MRKGDRIEVMKIVIAIVMFSVAAMIGYNSWQSRQYIPPDPSHPVLPKEAVALSGKDMFGRKYPADLAGFRLLVLPSCQACSVKRLDLEKIRKDGMAKTIVIIAAGKEDITPKMNSFLKSAAFVVVDPWPSTVPSMLERYAPAFYSLDKESKMNAVETL